MTEVAGHGTVGDAYVAGLESLLERGDVVPPVRDPNSVATEFGQRSRATIELLGKTLEVANPSAGVIVSPVRPLSLAYCIGLFLWTVAGSDELDWIAYYNPQASRFSDDGQRIAGAFGKRLVSFRGTNQLETVLKTLSSDSASRRTVGTIITPDESARPTRDYPCAIAVQYLQRDGALHALTYMRSQSALMVLPYDMFLFTTLQRWIAVQLGLALGSYRHVAGSFHMYDDEVVFARRVLQGGVQLAELGGFGVNDSLDSLLAFENQLRTDAVGKNKGNVRDSIQSFTDMRTSASSFEDQARCILLTHAAQRLHLDDDLELLIELLPEDLRLASEVSIARLAEGPR